MRWQENVYFCAFYEQVQSFSGKRKIFVRDANVLLENAKFLGGKAIFFVRMQKH